MERDDARLNEVTNEILIIVLVVLLAVIIAVFMFGVFTPVDKTAYVIPRFGIGNASGTMVITVFSRGGEPVYFNGSPQVKYRAELYVDTQSGSFRAVPDPALTVFKPGDMIYVYYTGSGFVLTDTLSVARFQTLPEGKIVVSLVDATSRVTIARETLVLAATTMATTAPTAPTTKTVTAPTAVPPVRPAANFNWDETGSGGDIHFTDTSTGTPTSWSWNFGDGGTSTIRNPIHRYSKGASYSVILTITRSTDGATSSIAKPITV